MVAACVIEGMPNGTSNIAVGTSIPANLSCLMDYGRVLSATLKRPWSQWRSTPQIVAYQVFVRSFLWSWMARAWHRAGGRRLVSSAFNALQREVWLRRTCRTFRDLQCMPIRCLRVGLHGRRVKTSWLSQGRQARRSNVLRLGDTAQWWRVR